MRHVPVDRNKIRRQNVADLLAGKDATNERSVLVSHVFAAKAYEWTLGAGRPAGAGDLNRRVRDKWPDLSARQRNILCLYLRARYFADHRREEPEP